MVPGVLATRRGFTVAIAALAVLAAVVACVLHVWLFDQGSLNADEVAYVLQAEAIAEGQLFLDVPQPADAYQPWFFVERSPGFVSKYLPLLSAFLALGLVTVGSIVPVLAVFAALVPVAVAALARELGLDRPAAVAAATLVALSPVVLIESALPLSYVPFLAGITTAWLLVVRLGHHRAGAAGAAALGLVTVAVACLRPYDTVLLVVPGLVWVAYRRRADLARLVPAAVAAGLPLALAMAAYNAEATGRPWRLPFALLEPSDGIGFGSRRLAPEYGYVNFHPGRGLAGLVVHFGLGSLLWLLLGLLLVPAAVAAWRAAAGARRLLLVLVVVHVAGYAVFWGPWNISIHWGGANRVLGPVYAMPVLVLVVLAGLPVLARWHADHPGRVRWLAALGVVIAAAQFGVALWQASIDRDRTEEVLAAAERAATVGPVLVGVDPPYLGNPVTGLVDGYALAAAYPVPPPGRPVPSLLQLPKRVYGSSTLSYAVTEQRRVEGPAVPLDVHLTDDRGEVLVVERAGRTTVCAITGDVHLVLTPQGHEGCDDGSPVPERWEEDTTRHCADTSCLSIAAYRTRSGELRRLQWRRLPVQTSPQGVALLVDGDLLAASGDGWFEVTSPLATTG